VLTLTIAGVLTVKRTYSDSVLYYDTGDGEKLLVSSSGKNCLIDVSDNMNSDMYSSFNFLEDEAVTYLNSYMIVRYRYNLPLTISELAASVKVGEVLLPKPRNDSEDEIARALYKLAETKNFEVHFYDLNSPIKYGNIEITPLFSNPYGSGALSCGFYFKGRDDGAVYFSSGAIEEYPFIYDSLLESSTAVFGSYGKKYGDRVYFDEKTECLKTLIINGESVVIGDELKEHSEYINIMYGKEKYYLIR
jgi:hypothetical protein